MPRPVLVGMLAAVATLLLATGVVAAAVIFGSDDGPGAENASAVATATIAASPTTPAATATSTAAVAPTLQPGELPPELNQLPAAVRERVRQQYLAGQITREQIAAMVEARSAAARFGIITEIEPDKIEIQTWEGEDFSWEITEDTAIKAINRPGTTDDLSVGDSVFILSRDGGKTAFSIDNYGVLATP